MQTFFLFIQIDKYVIDPQSVLLRSIIRTAKKITRRKPGKYCSENLLKLLPKRSLHQLL